MIELSRFGRGPWSLFDDLVSLQDELNRAFNDAEMTPSWSMRKAAYPPMNVWSSKDGLVIDAEVPGADPAKVEVSVVGDELTVRGSAGGDGGQEGMVFHRRERRTGEFSRTVQLPFRADAAGVKASCRKGVLRLTVPRSADEKPRRIAIEAA
jgi:HSP20 family protein